MPAIIPKKAGAHLLTMGLITLANERPRRDLLQRHHFTYHEVKEPMQPVPGGAPLVAGRTPIACINCASAKTGCGKRVPCSRCAEKNLPCEARFARWTAKAANRQASSSSLSTVSTVQTTQIDINSPDRMVRKDSINDVGTFHPGGAISPQLQGSSPKKQDYPPPGRHSVTDIFVPSPEGTGPGMDTFMCLNDEFLAGRSQLSRPHDMEPLSVRA
jgi:hypothetical protein